MYICKQEQKRNEYAKEYKKEKQNGHLPCDAPCEHSPLFTQLERGIGFYNSGGIVGKPISFNQFQRAVKRINR